MKVDRNLLCRMRLFAKLHPKLTRASREVFQEMLSLYGIAGRLFPSHATLAKRAKCAEKTVRRALVQLEALGVVSWARRRRKPNVYRVCFDAAAVAAPVRAAPARGTGPTPVVAVSPDPVISQIDGALADFAALFAARRAAAPQ